MSTEQIQARSGAPQSVFADGVAHYDGGRTADAAEAFERVRAEQPDHAGAWLYLGLIALSADDVASSRDLLQRATTLDDSNALAWHYFGISLERLGFGDAAADCFRRALDLDPEASLSAKALARVERPTPAPDRAAPSPHSDRDGEVPVLSEVYGVYEVLSQSSDPLHRQPLPLMDQARHNGHARVSAFTYRFLAGALAGFLLAYIVVQGRQSAKYWGSTSNTRIASTSSILALTLLFDAFIVGWLVLLAATTRYVIDRGRVQVISGVLVRKHTNLELYRAIDITHTRNLVQRFTGDGTLVIQTSTHKVRLVGLSRTSRMRVTYQQLLNLVFALRANNYVRGIIS